MRPSRALVVVGAIAASAWFSPVKAQTTSCGWESGRWVCRADNGPFYNYQPVNPLQGVQQGQSLVDQMYARKRQRDEESATEAAQSIRQSFLRDVGQLTAAGRCDDARKMALTAGDFDLAQQVTATCK